MIFKMQTLSAVLTMTLQSGQRQWLTDGLMEIKGLFLN